jgi:hypothetical protein
MSHVPYASVVGSLMYGMVYTRLYITHVVGVLNRYMSKPRKEHCTIEKRVFRYLCGITNNAIFYQGRLGPDKVLDVHGFVESDSAGDLDHKISISGYFLNLFEGEINWLSKIQVVVALSTIQSEYMVATHVGKEVVWL